LCHPLRFSVDFGQGYFGSLGDNDPSRFSDVADKSVASYLMRLARCIGMQGGAGRT
jgi:hypothetical protein